MMWMKREVTLSKRVEDERVAPHDDGDGVVAEGEAEDGGEEALGVGEDPDGEEEEEVDEVAEVGEEVVVAARVVGGSGWA